MSVKYEISATNTGGRKGHVQTDDKAIDTAILPPDQDGDGLNPEQLFAAGYASCFNGAFDLMLKQGGVKNAEPEVTLTVQLLDDDQSESPKLGVKIDAKVKNISKEEAEKYLAQAHDFCPYSKAVRGNIDVELNVTAE